MFYPDLCKMSKWGRDKFLSAPDPWALRIHNHMLTSIIDCGLHFLEHFFDKDLRGAIKKKWKKWDFVPLSVSFRDI